MASNGSRGASAVCCPNRNNPGKRSSSSRMPYSFFISHAVQTWQVRLHSHRTCILSQLIIYKR